MNSDRALEAYYRELHGDQNRVRSGAWLAPVLGAAMAYGFLLWCSRPAEGPMSVLPPSPMQLASAGIEVPLRPQATLDRPRALRGAIGSRLV